MPDRQIRPEPAGEGSTRTAARSTRTAALWATVVAVPVAVIVALVLVAPLNQRTAAVAPAPSPTPVVLPTAAVPMPAPKLSARHRTLCRALLAQLPVTLRNLPQRPVTAGPEQNAAYGAPAITVACGTVAPAVPDESLLMTMDGVCWFTEQRPDTTVWTAIDREAPVQVGIPTGYDAPAQWANEFSGTIIATVPAIKDVPSGCA